MGQSLNGSGSQLCDTFSPCAAPTVPCTSTKHHLICSVGNIDKLANILYTIAMHKRGDKSDKRLSAQDKNRKQMKVSTQKDPWGGSRMGGGGDHQAEAYALVAAKILAE